MILRRLAAGVVALRRVWLGLVTVGVAFYGAWLIYRPAGYLTAAALLLLELVTDRG